MKKRPLLSANMRVPPRTLPADAGALPVAIAEPLTLAEQGGPAGRSEALPLVPASVNAGETLIDIVQDLTKGVSMASFLSVNQCVAFQWRLSSYLLTAPFRRSY